MGSGGPPRGPCFGARFPVGQAGGTIVYCYPVSSHLCKVHFWKNSSKTVIFALSITAEWKKNRGSRHPCTPPKHPPFWARFGTLREGVRDPFWTLFSG